MQIKARGSVDFTSGIGKDGFGNCEKSEAGKERDHDEGEDKL